jgi:hypothetical protein
MIIDHFVSSNCRGEICRICSRPATHRVAEEIPFDDPEPSRGRLTAYLCCSHFALVIGPSVPCRRSGRTGAWTPAFARDTHPPDPTEESDATERNR